ncbi:MAG: hypothetical protein C5B50_28545 [Verrucomicrobia bacterium]|nr:MAG: hypothetical protein C5B50_28545 [Verrucomicrobiota bacterium]
MKRNLLLLLGTMLSASVLARQATNAPGAVSSTSATTTTVVTNAATPAKTNAPASKAVKKKSAPKKKAAKKPLPAAKELKTVPLVPGPATVQASNVNVRAQAKLKSEVVARVSKGQQVTVIEEIVHNNSAANEPSAWAKVALPPSAKAFVSSAYLSNNAVGPKRLKVRAGPSEDYSVLGILSPGEAVKPIAVKGEWTQIEPPSGTFAFIAAQFLTQEKEAPTVAATTPTAPIVPEAPTPTTNTVPESPTVAATTTTENPPTTTAPTTETPTTTNATAQAPTTTTPPEPATEEPPPKRIVSHEGFVRGLTSIQAPSHFALVGLENGRTINYLYSPSRQFDLRRFKGLRVVVTGEESLDERWGNTPLLTIQRIEVAEEAP